MAFEIVGGYGPAKEFNIKALERRVGCRLPEDYRTFLIRYNGGIPVPNVFCFFDRIRGVDDESRVDRFLSIGVSEYLSIEKHLEVYSGRIPDGFIPIARDAGGGLVLIGLKGKGRVCFWDHEFEADAGEKASDHNIYAVSDSFNEFLTGLYDIDE